LGGSPGLLRQGARGPRRDGQVLSMPLFFASNAIHPLNIMPPWLRVIASLNPLTYLVDALRGLMVHG